MKCPPAMCLSRKWRLKLISDIEHGMLLERWSGFLGSWR